MTSPESRGVTRELGFCLAWPAPWPRESGPHRAACQELGQKPGGPRRRRAPPWTLPSCPLCMCPAGSVGEGVTRLVCVRSCSVPPPCCQPTAAAGRSSSPFPPPPAPFSERAVAGGFWEDSACQWPGLLAPCLNTSSRPGLPSSRVPFPVHADRGLHEAGMSECTGDPCTG